MDALQLPEAQSFSAATESSAMDVDVSSVKPPATSSSVDWEHRIVCIGELRAAARTTLHVPPDDSDLKTGLSNPDAYVPVRLTVAPTSHDADTFVIWVYERSAVLSSKAERSAIGRLEEPMASALGRLLRVKSIRLEARAQRTSGLAQIDGILTILALVFTPRRNVAAITEYFRRSGVVLEQPQAYNPSDHRDAPLHESPRAPDGLTLPTLEEYPGELQASASEPPPQVKATLKPKKSRKNLPKSDVLPPQEGLLLSTGPGSNALSGLSFAALGKMAVLNATKVKNLVIEHGGRMMEGGPSGTTDYIVVGRESKVKFLSEDAFLEMISPRTLPPSTTTPATSTADTTIPSHPLPSDSATPEATTSLLAQSSATDPQTVVPSPEAASVSPPSDNAVPSIPTGAESVPVPTTLNELRLSGLTLRDPITNNAAVLWLVQTRAHLRWPMTQVVWQQYKSSLEHNGTSFVSLKYFDDIASHESPENSTLRTPQSCGTIKIFSSALGRSESVQPPAGAELGVVEQSVTNRLAPLLLKRMVGLARAIKKSAAHSDLTENPPLNLIVTAKGEDAEFVAKWLQLFNLTTAQPSVSDLQGAPKTQNDTSSRVAESSVKCHTDANIDGDTLDSHMAVDPPARVLDVSIQTDGDVHADGREESLRAELANARQIATDALSDLHAARELLAERDRERAESLEAANNMLEQKKANARFWQAKLDSFDDDYPIPTVGTITR